ncbi:hypothetical protein [Leucobacter sp. M11]|uniref:hypothetical protein n=1 Tax=Leucobacter sp. M11 TaxID=2993565 RepID=UPI002D80055F|nr:hypothetical protein [Leucobacter sp. M11]MEB4614096.1 hypothetical protein [Leucobacter sp. M11]
MDPSERISDAAELGRALFPELAARVGASAPGPADGDAAEHWLRAETERLRAGAWGPGLARFRDTSAGERLRDAFARASEVALALGVFLPEPESFFVAGVPRGEPADGDLPVPAPHGLGLAGWQRLFSGSSPSGWPRLVCSTEVVRWFAALDAVPAPDAAIPPLRGRPGQPRWTLRWLPADPAPPEVGRPFQAARPGEHPSLPELLMLQAMRVVRGEPLLDPHGFTWLAGALPDARFAARHGADPARGAIRISTRDRGDQGPHIGTRPARQGRSSGPAT